MTDKTALIRSILPRADGIRTPFFAEAYKAARAGDQDLIARDGEKLQGCLVHIAGRDRLNPHLTDERQAALQTLEAYLSLGLSEAAEDNIANAVALLKERADQIDLFVQLGMTLHDELREKAAKTKSRSVLKLESGLYGIFDLKMEAEIGEIGHRRTLFSGRDEYHRAEERVRQAEKTIDLSGYFPLRHGIDAGAYYTAFQQKAYRRRDEGTPGAMGSVFNLFFRSFLLKMLSEKKSWEASRYIGKDIPEFLNLNFVSFAYFLKELIQDVFFDPRKTAESIPLVLRGIEVYLGTEIAVFSHMGRYVKPALKSSELLGLAGRMAESLLVEFGEEVRAYYKQAEGVDITADDLNKFWYPHVLVRAKGEQPVDSGELLPLVGPKEIARASVVKDLHALLKIDPREIADYLSGAGEWSEAFRESFVTQYRWDAVVEALNEEAFLKALVVFVNELGPEILRRFSAKHLKLEFWLKAWGETPALRSAILTFFQEERYERKINARILCNAVENAFGTGDDARLLALLLASVLRDEEGEYITKGVSVETWRGTVFAVSRHAESLRLIWSKIPLKLREPVLATFTSTDEERIRRIVGTL